MKLRVLAAGAATAIIILTATGCDWSSTAAPAGPATPGPSASQWPAVLRYLETHPVQHVSGMTASVVISVKVDTYACLNLVCHTWTALVMDQGGVTEEISSDQGDSDLAGYLLPGDYFYWPAGGTLDEPSDVTIIRRGAVQVIS